MLEKFVTVYRPAQAFCSLTDAIARAGSPQKTDYTYAYPLIRATVADPDVSRGRLADLRFPRPKARRHRQVVPRVRGEVERA